nr:reverse transcriptase domain-containing protein [Tanacetum cinerariifolium]
MSTRSSTRNNFPPLGNLELTIRRRSRVDPTLLNDFEIATNGNGDPPVPDLQTMEELCPPTLNGQGGPIALIAIQATNFGLKNNMIQQVQNSCQFHGLPGDDVNKNLDKFLHITQCIKVNGVTDDALRLYLFPHSLTHHATAWFDRLPMNSINTFEHHDTINAAAGETFMKRRPEECYDLIENMTTHHNDWDTFVQRIESSSSITSSFDPEIVALKAEMAEINKNLMKVLQINQQVKTVTHKCKTCGGPHSYNDCPATVGQTQNDLKGITTRSGNAYQGPTIPTTSSPPKVVEREIEVTKDTMHPTNNGSTKDVQPPVVHVKTPIPNSKPIISPDVEPVVSPVSGPKPNQKPSIPYLSRLHDQKLRNKANDQKEKFFKIFQDLDFNISFADALIPMPKIGPTINSSLTKKDKLFELDRKPLNEHCSAVLLKKLPEKLGDPGKFLIRCDFPRMNECLAWADLGTSINLMPLSVWNKLSLPEMSPTCMNLELADRSISPVTFNLDQTSRYSANYDAMSVNRIDLINVACEEYPQEVLGFSMSGNPTPSTEPIASNSSLTLTPFGDSDFLLEETDAFLAIDDEPISSEINDSYYDLEGYILLLEEFLNDDPSSPPLPPQELKGDDKFPVIIAKDLKDEEKTALIKVLKSHKQALAWQLSDIKGIDPKHYTHKILIENDFKPAVQHQRKVNLKIYEVIKKEVLKLLYAVLIYPISDSPSLNDATRKDHFPLPFMDQMLERLAGNEYYYFLDGFSGYFQIPIDSQDQENTTFTYPYGMFSYRRMPFRLCNAPDDFSVFVNSFGTCLSHFDKMFKWCKGTNLCLNWEKSHLMVKEIIILGHKISKNRIEVDEAKYDVIAKLPHPTAVKARPMTRLLEKDTPFFFSKECIEAFQTLKKRLTEASILVAPDWDLPFELMCDTSDSAIGERIPRKGQNQIKTELKQEACRSREKSKAVTVKRARKTEEMQKEGSEMNSPTKL